jgi:hypothetical protein
VHVKAEIEQALAPIVGLPIWAAGREVDLLWLQLGARRRLSDDGGEREVGTYTLLIACPWRLVTADRIVVGSGDLLTPADPDEEIETFDWDIAGASWLDVRLAELTVAHESDPPVVLAVAADDLGGIRLSLTAELVLELFPTSTPTGHVSTEFWRLVQPGTDAPSFVVGTFGTEAERES